MPTTSQVSANVQSLCQQMSMSECSKCSGTSISTCDLLSVYSNICLSMPTMSGCVDWTDMCLSISEWSYCSSSGSSTTNMNMNMNMAMYFHTTLSETILFQNWTPHNGEQYFGTLVAIFVIVFFLDGLVTLWAYLEWVWSFRASGFIEARIKKNLYPHQEFNLVSDLTRAFLRTSVLVLSYFLMLIAMTLNVGYFVAIMISFFISTFCFSRFRNHHFAHDDTNCH